MNTPMNLPNRLLVNGRQMRVFGVKPQAHNYLQLTLGTRNQAQIAVCVPTWFLEQGHGGIDASGTHVEFINNEEPPRPL